MKRTLVCILIVLAFAQTSGAQTFSIIPNAGISKDMRSDINEWKMGFNFAVAGFFKTSEKFSVGGRIAYHSWGIDGEEWAKDVYSGGYGSWTFDKATGTQSVIEIMPSIKYLLTPTEGSIQLSLQAGAGLLFISPSDIMVAINYRTANSYGHIETTVQTSTLTGFGGQVGLPIAFSGTVEFLPLYTLYMANGDAYHHFALNIGILLGKK